MAKKATTALSDLKDELARLGAALDRYEQHQTEKGREEAREARRFGRPVHLHDSVSSCPERAAVKRASMDVTRALARLRRETGLW